MNTNNLEATCYYSRSKKNCMGILSRPEPRPEDGSVPLMGDPSLRSGRQKIRPCRPLQK